jgi:hypothetical protein
LQPREPVWRRRMGLGYGFFGRWHWTVAPFCEQHSGPRHEVHSSGPCENCGRLVHNTEGWKPRRRVYCCERCKLAQQATMARGRRTQARGATRVCAECGETFEPPRADAKFCSVRCKQKAYRKRVTLDECLSGSTLESRNGEGVTLDECLSGKTLESCNAPGRKAA